MKSSTISAGVFALRCSLAKSCYPRNTKDDINYGMVHTHLSYGIRLLLGGGGGVQINVNETLDFKNVPCG